MFSYKGRLPSNIRSSLVYWYSCARCACEYVGSTTRMLHTKVCEHIAKIHRTGCERNQEALLILESLYIYDFKPSINDMRGVHKLLIGYYFV